MLKYPAPDLVPQPPESTPAPQVRRAVITIDAIRRRRLLDVLGYVELQHDSIDEDQFRIELEDLTSLTRLFTTDDPSEEISVSFTHADLFALGVILDAAWHLIRRDESRPPSIGRVEIDDLRRWVDNAERWFITPLKFEILHFDAEMHRRITEVLWYVEHRADFIDPDMFRIDVEKVRMLQNVFHATLDDRADPPSAAVVEYRDVDALAYITMAAREYSLRKTEKGLLDVTDAQLAEMLDWLGRVADRLRVLPS